MASYRSVRSAWRHTLLSLTLLAVGIAATVTVYALVKAFLLDPLPYPAQDRLVRLYESKPPEFPEFAVAPGKFAIWEAESHAWESMAMYAGSSSLLTGGREAARLQSVTATPAFFTTLGVQAQLGRTYVPADGAQDAALVVLAHHAWQTVFGGDPDIVGQTLTLDGQAATVVGVLPASFAYPAADVDVYTLWRLSPAERSTVGAHLAHVIARLRPGATLNEADAELQRISERLAREYPDDSSGWQVRLVPLREDLVGALRPQLILLLAGVGLLLLIACANVASLTLVRMSGRLHEFAVRRSQGASQRHLITLQAVDGMVLGVVAGVLALVLVAYALAAIRLALPFTVPQLESLRVGADLALVAFGLSVLASTLAAVVPAVWAVRRGLASDLRSGTRSIAGRFSRGRAALIVGEIALAVVLLSGAGLLTRSLWALTQVDPGFKMDAGVHVDIDLPAARYEGPPAAAYYAQLIERIEALPGVRSAGLTHNLPMVSDYWVQVERAGRPAASRDTEPTSMYYAITPGYLPSMGVRLLRGRTFTEADRAGAPGVVMVSEGFAERYFPGEDPIGKRLRQVSDDDLPWLEIVGVVADVRHYGLDRDAPPGLYEPLAQAPFTHAHLVIASELAPAALSASLKSILRELDADVPLGSVMTTASMVSNGLIERRMLTWLIAGFAVSALLLCSVGLYGALSWLVSQRARDLGVRLALGARRVDVLRWVLRQGLTLAALGGALGLALSLGGARSLEGLVYGVSPRDPLTLGAILVGMLLIAIAATLLPALRATRVEPASVLRGE
ncbi:MAG: ABC transporter permease [Lysobacterales bacterium]